MSNCRNNFIFSSGHALYWAKTGVDLKYEHYIMHECLTIPNEATRKCKEDLHNTMYKTKDWTTQL